MLFRSLKTHNLFFVKEKVGLFKAVNEYDILDPETQELLLQSTEKIGPLTKLLRFTDYKRNTPFNVTVSDSAGDPVIRVHRGISIFRSRVTVFDETDAAVGQFLQKLFSIGGAFRLLDMSEHEMGVLQGKWTSWEFTFKDDQGVELAKVSKKWAGIGRELFTTADNYMLQIFDAVEPEDPVRMLILAAVMCIDMVLKE